MIRALVEFLFVIVLAMVGRAIITSIFRGVGQASANAFQQTAEEAERRRRAGQNNPQDASGTVPKEAANAGVLHKDPVCGTYVSEATAFRETHKGKSYFFCSAACRQKFSPAASTFTGTKTAQR